METAEIIHIDLSGNPENVPLNIPIKISIKKLIPKVSRENLKFKLGFTPFEIGNVNLNDDLDYLKNSEGKEWEEQIPWDRSSPPIEDADGSIIIGSINGPFSRSDAGYYRVYGMDQTNKKFLVWARELRIVGYTQRSYFQSDSRIILTFSQKNMLNSQFSMPVRVLQRRCIPNSTSMKVLDFFRNDVKILNDRIRYLLDDYSPEEVIPDDVGVTIFKTGDKEQDFHLANLFILATPEEFDENPALKSLVIRSIKFTFGISIPDTDVPPTAIAQPKSEYFDEWEKVFDYLQSIGISQPGESFPNVIVSYNLFTDLYLRYSLKYAVVDKSILPEFNVFSGGTLSGFGDGEIALIIKGANSVYDSGIYAFQVQTNALGEDGWMTLCAYDVIVLPRSSKIRLHTKPQNLRSMDEISPDLGEINTDDHLDVPITLRFPLPDVSLGENSLDSGVISFLNAGERQRKQDTTLAISRSFAQNTPVVSQVNTEDEPEIAWGTDFVSPMRADQNRVYMFGSTSQRLASQRTLQRYLVNSGLDPQTLPLGGSKLLDSLLPIRTRLQDARPQFIGAKLPQTFAEGFQNNNDYLVHTASIKFLNGIVKVLGNPAIGAVPRSASDGSLNFSLNLLNLTKYAKAIELSVALSRFSLDHLGDGSNWNREEITNVDSVPGAYRFSPKSSWLNSFFSLFGGGSGSIPDRDTMKNIDGFKSFNILVEDKQSKKQGWNGQVPISVSWVENPQSKVQTRAKSKTTRVLEFNSEGSFVKDMTAYYSAPDPPSIYRKGITVTVSLKRTTERGTPEMWTEFLVLGPPIKDEVDTKFLDEKRTAAERLYVYLGSDPQAKSYTNSYWYYLDKFDRQILDLVPKVFVALTELGKIISELGDAISGRAPISKTIETQMNELKTRLEKLREKTGTETTALAVKVTDIQKRANLNDLNRMSQKDIATEMAPILREFETSIQDVETARTNSETTIKRFHDLSVDIDKKREQYLNSRNNLITRIEDILKLYPYSTLDTDAYRQAFDMAISAHKTLYDAIDSAPDSVDKLEASLLQLDIVLQEQQKMDRTLDIFAGVIQFLNINKDQYSRAMDIQNDNDMILDQELEFLENTQLAPNLVKAKKAYASATSALAKLRKKFESYETTIIDALKSGDDTRFPAGFVRIISETYRPNMFKVYDDQFKNYYKLLQEFVNQEINKLVKEIDDLKNNSEQFWRTIQTGAVQLKIPIEAGEAIWLKLPNLIDTLQEDTRTRKFPLTELIRRKEDIVANTKRLETLKNDIEKRIDESDKAKKIREDAEKATKADLITNIGKLITATETSVKKWTGTPTDYTDSSGVQQLFADTFKTAPDQILLTVQPMLDAITDFRDLVDVITNMESGKEYEWPKGTKFVAIEPQLSILQTLSIPELRDVIAWFQIDQINLALDESYKRFTEKKADYERAIITSQQQITDAQRTIHDIVTQYKQQLQRLTDVILSHGALVTELGELENKLKTNPVGAKGMMVVPPDLLANISAKKTELRKKINDNLDILTTETQANVINPALAERISNSVDPASFGLLSAQDNMNIVMSVTDANRRVSDLFTDLTTYQKDVKLLSDRVDQTIQDAMDGKIPAFITSRPLPTAPSKPPSTPPIIHIIPPGGTLHSSVPKTGKTQDESALAEQLAPFINGINRYFLGLNPKRISEVYGIQYSPLDANVQSSVFQGNEVAVLNVSDYVPSEYIKNEDDRYGFYWSLPEGVYGSEYRDIDSGRVTSIVANTFSNTGETSNLYSCTIIDKDPLKEQNSSKWVPIGISLSDSDSEQDLSGPYTERSYDTRNVLFPRLRTVTLSQFDSYQWVQNLLNPSGTGYGNYIPSAGKVIATINFNVAMRQVLDPVEFGQMAKYLLEHPGYFPNTLKMLELIHFGYPRIENPPISGKYGLDLFNYLGVKNIFDAFYAQPRLSEDIAESFLMDIMLRDKPRETLPLPLLPLQSFQIVEQIIDVMRLDIDGKDSQGERLLYKRTLEMIRRYLGFPTDPTDVDWKSGQEMLDAVGGDKRMATIIARDIGVRSLFPTLVNDHLTWGFENGYPGRTNWKLITFWRYLDLKPRIKQEASRRRQTVSDMPFYDILQLIQSYGSYERQLPMKSIREYWNSKKYPPHFLDELQRFASVFLPERSIGSSRTMSKQNMLELLRDQGVLDDEISSEDVNRLYDKYSYESTINLVSSPPVSAIGDEILDSKEVEKFLVDKGRGDLRTHAHAYYDTSKNMQFGGISNQTIPEGVLQKFITSQSYASEELAPLVNDVLEYLEASRKIERKDPNDAWVFATLSHRFERFRQLQQFYQPLTEAPPLPNWRQYDPNKEMGKTVFKYPQPNLGYYQRSVSLSQLAEDIKRFYSRYNRNLETPDLSLLKEFWWVRDPDSGHQPLFGVGSEILNQVLVNAPDQVLVNTPNPLTSATMTVVNPIVSTSGSRVINIPPKIVNAFTAPITKDINSIFGDNAPLYLASLTDSLKNKPKFGKSKFTIKGKDFTTELGGKEDNVVLKALLPYLSDGSTANASMKSNIFETIVTHRNTIGKGNLVDKIINALDQDNILWAADKTYKVMSENKYALAILSDPTNSSLDVTDVIVNDYQTFLVDIWGQVKLQHNVNQNDIENDIQDLIRETYRVNHRKHLIPDPANFNNVRNFVQDPKFDQLLQDAKDLIGKFRKMTESATLDAVSDFVYDRDKIVDYLTSNKELQDLENTFIKTMRSLQKMVFKKHGINAFLEFDHDGLEMFESSVTELESRFEQNNPSTPRVIELQESIRELIDKEAVKRIRSHKIITNLEDLSNISTGTPANLQQIEDDIREANQEYQKWFLEMNKWDYEQILNKPADRFADIDQGTYETTIRAYFTGNPAAKSEDQFVNTSSNYYQKLLPQVQTYRQTVVTSLNTIFTKFIDSGVSFSHPHTLWFNSIAALPQSNKRVENVIGTWNIFVLTFELLSWPFRLIENAFSSSETFPALIFTTGRAAVPGAAELGSIIKALEKVYHRQILRVRELGFEASKYEFNGVQILNADLQKTYKKRIDNAAPSERKLVENALNDVHLRILDQFNLFYESYKVYGIPLRDSGLLQQFPVLGPINLASSDGYKKLSTMNHIFDSYIKFSGMQNFYTSTVQQVSPWIHTTFDQILDRHMFILNRLVALAP